MVRMSGILIIEENSWVRHLVRAVLEERFPEAPVSEAAGTDAAVAAVAAVKPDVVLLRLDARGGNGVALAHRLKELHTDGHIIIVTDYNEPEYREVARQNGFGCFMADGSVELEDFMSSIRSAIAAGSLQRA